MPRLFQYPGKAELLLTSWTERMTPDKWLPEQQPPLSAWHKKAREVVGPERFLAVDAGSLPADAARAAEEICRLLEARGFIPEDVGPLTGGAGI